MVEFVSYDGKYPCLCMGTLTIKVDGKEYRFNHAMISGGCIQRSEDWDMWKLTWTSIQNLSLIRKRLHVLLTTMLNKAAVVAVFNELVWTNGFKW